MIEKVVGKIERPDSQRFGSRLVINGDKIHGAKVSCHACILVLVEKLQR